MAYTRVWDESTPENTQLAKLGAQDMREIQQNVRERVASFGAGLAANRPTPEASFVGVIYWSTDTNVIECWSGTTWVSINSVIEAIASGIVPPPPPLPDPDACRVRRSSNQILSDVTWAAISFDAERYDNHSMHDNVQPTRLVCKTAGKHLIIGNAQFNPSVTGYRDLGIRLNQTGAQTTGLIALTNQSGMSAGTDLEVSTIYNLIVGDYVELTAFQNSGGNLDIVSSSALGNGNFSPEFMIQWLGV